MIVNHLPSIAPALVPGVILKYLIGARTLTAIGPGILHKLPPKPVANSLRYQSIGRGSLDVGYVEGAVVVAACAAVKNSCLLDLGLVVEQGVLLFAAAREVVGALRELD